ncbi:glycosyltransferase family 9 protein [Dyella sp. A6]|uniref:glycosyltransferase family 9 protein n=1 Tax=Dyella aluminiiresistens TaxID=3069105 RepID=UPI002E79DD8F|nr:glycosyltransferase family 9 protein [Dyella sp. A6]
MRLRRRLVGMFSSMLLRSVDSGLCPPGGLPGQGMHRILVCRLNHRLGNTLLLSPLLREIEARYPGAEIDIMCSGHAADMVFGEHPMLGSIFALPSKAARHLWTLFAQIRAMRRNRYDLAIDACADSYSGRMALGLSHATYKLGFPLDETPGPLQGYLDACPTHMATRSVHLLRAAIGDNQSADWPTLGIELDTEELVRGRRALAAIAGHDGDGPVIGLFPNATGAKRYPETWWSDFVTTLQTLRPDIRIVNVLADHGRSQLPGTHATFYSRNLRRMAAVFAAMDGFISGDCGVMHLACASETPTLGLFIQHNLEKYQPYGPHNRGMHAPVSLGGAAAAEASVRWLEQACPPRTTKAADLA